MARPLRVLVAGDDGVGKSSILYTFVSGQFPEAPPPVVHDITLPPERYFEDAEVTLMDSSPRDQEDLLAKLSIADAIILVYSVDDDATFEHLGEYWLPLIEERNRKTTVFIAGNKADTPIGADPVTEERKSSAAGREGDAAALAAADAAAAAAEDAYVALVERVEPLLQRFRFIVDFIHVSASCEVALGDLFFKAIDSVVNPIAPLFDVQYADLKPEASIAIGRLFRCFDQDMDGVLNEREMGKIQRLCFGLDLEAEDLATLREVVQTEGRGGYEANLTDAGFTTEGVTTLCRHFIEENKAQVVWKMLRLVGYDNDLSVAPPGALNFMAVGDGAGRLELTADSVDQAVFQLTAGAAAYLERLFDRYDAGGGGALDAAAVAEIFSILPSSIRGRSPWGSISLDDPPLTRSQWSAQWSQTAALAPVVAAQHLYYLGFQGDDPERAAETQNYLVCLPAPRPATDAARRRRLGIGYGVDGGFGLGLDAVTVKVLLLSPDPALVDRALGDLARAPGAGRACTVSTSVWPHATPVVAGEGNPRGVAYEFHSEEAAGAGEAAPPRVTVLFLAPGQRRQAADLVFLLYDEDSEESKRAALSACDALPPSQARAFVRRRPESGAAGDRAFDARIDARCRALGIPPPFDLAGDSERAAEVARGALASVAAEEHLPKSLARAISRAFSGAPSWYSTVWALAVGGIFAVVGYEFWRRSSKGDAGREGSASSGSGATAPVPTGASVGDGGGATVATSPAAATAAAATAMTDAPAVRLITEEARPMMCQLAPRHPYMLLFTEWAGTLRA